jgi:hypothetical protein
VQRIMRLKFLVVLLFVAAPLFAQDREVPYWASIKAEKLNLRAGPGRDFPVQWVYRRPGLPLKVIRVHEGWRLVRDPAGRGRQLHRDHRRRQDHGDGHAGHDDDHHHRDDAGSCRHLIAGLLLEEGGRRRSPFLLRAWPIPTSGRRA